HADFQAIGTAPVKMKIRLSRRPRGVAGRDLALVCPAGIIVLSMPESWEMPCSRDNSVSIVGTDGEALVESSTGFCRLVAAVDDTATMYWNNLALLSRAPGLELRGVARRLPCGPGRWRW
ncbi:MAG TPA: hypothetical protein VGO93_11085, partial [Candidatus Xenobia bacterium]